MLTSNGRATNEEYCSLGFHYWIYRNKSRAALCPSSQGSCRTQPRWQSSFCHLAVIEIFINSKTSVRIKIENTFISRLQLWSHSIGYVNPCRPFVKIWMWSMVSYIQGWNQAKVICKQGPETNIWSQEGSEWGVEKASQWGTSYFVQFT